MSDERIARIEARLVAALHPSYLQIKDQSHLHVGHAGARDGRGHFEVSIAADALADLNRVAAHRKIYEALGELMQTDIHALKINLRQN